ncbi:MAG: orotidine-5'-phosphate decarboxylase [Verrucomicrobia bacterium]|nr:orotidine-5'-phosphate decarboxylase [Verrucomicrobiota bacterium]
MATELIVALDVPTLDDASRLLDRLGGSVRWFKVGMQLFTATGPAVVREIRSRGAKVFLDLKFHDIPNTVAGAAQSAAALGVEMFNVHASGGEEMMRAAVTGGGREGGARPLVIAVTILTSQAASEADVLKLARAAKASGLDGVVCSAREAVTLKRELGADFKLVCPGIRPSWSETGDQKRIVTPRDAVKAGADYIVVGRPILAAPNPAEAAKRVLDEMQAA